MKNLGLTIAAMMTVFFTHAQPQEIIDLSQEDYRFTINTSKTGLLEIKLGELALQKANSNEVKALGQKSVEYYTTANSQLKTIADQRGIFIAAGLDKKQEKFYQKLAEKTGEDFDKAYTKAISKNHKEVKESFERQLRKGTDIDLKIWASAKIQTLEQQVEYSEMVQTAIEKEESYTFK